MGSDAIGGIVASDPCPAGTTKTLINGDGEESSGCAPATPAAA
jgi:hypothetical protein